MDLDAAVVQHLDADSSTPGLTPCLPVLHAFCSWLIQHCLWKHSIAQDVATHRQVVILPLQSLCPRCQALHGQGAVLAAQNLEAINHLRLNRCSLHCFGACTACTPR